jgi:hypothetical protein
MAHAQAIRELIAWLADEGFTAGPDYAWFRAGGVKVVVDDPEGYATVFALGPAPARLERYHVAFAGAPTEVMQAVIRHATEEDRAQTPE